MDFEKNTLELKSTVVKNKTIVYKDTTKTESSHETYELLPEITELLIAIKAEQDRNRKALHADGLHIHTARWQAVSSRQHNTHISEDVEATRFTRNALPRPPTQHSKHIV